MTKVGKHQTITVTIYKEIEIEAKVACYSGTNATHHHPCDPEVSVECMNVRLCGGGYGVSTKLMPLPNEWWDAVVEEAEDKALLEVDLQIMNKKKSSKKRGEAVVEKK